MNKPRVDRIEQLCNDHGLYVTTLEERIAIAKGSVRSWRNVNPSIDKIIKVANYFGVSTDYIMGRSDSKYILEETNDEGLVSLKRARSKMTDKDKRKMDDLMSITFPELFGKGDGDDY